MGRGKVQPCFWGIEAAVVQEMEWLSRTFSEKHLQILVDKFIINQSSECKLQQKDVNPHEATSE